jgi:DMSO/TMAO reductase YedYZ molybdopterin-dependent catalytic subunit
LNQPFEVSASLNAVVEERVKAIFKDADSLLDHGDGNFETRPEMIDARVTPTEAFFVRNNSASLAMDESLWRLHVEGDAVNRALSITYAQLKALPERSLEACLECAGNQRSMFGIVQGKPVAVDETQWRTGAVSNGVWTGTPLRYVLESAGLLPNAVDVLLIGLDRGSPEGGFRRALPLSKALHEDTILAWGMNGVPLPPDHGYPLRAIVPGWIGSSSIKWLDRIVVSSEHVWSRNNTTHYTLIGSAYTAEGESLGQVAREFAVKSMLALPWPARLRPGHHNIRGVAYSPVGGIARVEWSDDHGSTWNLATLVDGQVQYGWARFEFEWDARPGRTTIMTRATDVAGVCQPDHVPANAKGYLFNQPLPHPVQVDQAIGEAEQGTE